MKTVSPKAQLAAFIAKYSPDVARVARAALTKMRARFPAAHVLVYDNYNALAIGFAPDQRTSSAIFSIVAYPRWVTLFLLKGARLPDPTQRMRGSGNVVRHIVLESARTLDEADVRELMRLALERAGTTLGGRLRGKLIIKSISAKQRPRRPVLRSKAART